MTVKELRDVLATYPEDQFVHVRVWLTGDSGYGDTVAHDTVLGKVQQGSDGAALLTVHLTVVQK